ncbi:hypothetical protein OV287_39040 [Archangium sp. miwbw1]|uniref:Uncharacterized protein n=1 Tax=Archangium lansingense TaxID=2995310 RepID=A0ABT4AFI9_9BACT|nr:hypothetical protein [Archangium lansinium]MCY1080461.1 hypothetical protein [Archangium lansinium]
MIEMSRQRFEERVSKALDDIPPTLAKAMSNVVILVEDIPPEPTLLGRYEGVALESAGYRGARNSSAFRDR